MKALAELNAFSLASVLEPGNPEKGWNLLQEPLEEGVIPGIADQATVQWALGKSLGDRIMYMDEQGNSFQVQLVATLANSILQGNILIAEEQFVRHYPSISGYQYLLVDAPEERKGEVEELLSFALQDIGLQLTPAEDRLATFYAVENTYLSIFQILGSLGLILGAAGIAVVVLRNVLERRGELALLQAVGFSRDSIRWLIISEHWMLLLLGLGSGVLAGFMAVLPHLISRTPDSLSSWATRLPPASVCGSGTGLCVAGSQYRYFRTNKFRYTCISNTFYFVVWVFCAAVWAGADQPGVRILAGRVQGDGDGGIPRNFWYWMVSCSSGDQGERVVHLRGDPLRVIVSLWTECERIWKYRRGSVGRRRLTPRFRLGLNGVNACGSIPYLAKYAGNLEDEKWCRKSISWWEVETDMVVQE